MGQNKFEQYLLEFLDEVNNFKPKYTIISQRIEERLNKSLETYAKQLEQACGYLIDRSPTYQIWRLKL